MCEIPLVVSVAAWLFVGGVSFTGLLVFGTLGFVLYQESRSRKARANTLSSYSQAATALRERHKP